MVGETDAPLAIAICRHLDIAAGTAAPLCAFAYADRIHRRRADYRKFISIARQSPGRPAMTISEPDRERIQRAVATSLHEHWVLFLVEGLVLVVLGLLAILLPPIATLAVE